MNRNAIELEDPSSWPSRVRRSFEESIALFREYEAERQRIDMLLRRDVMARINTPENRHAAERNRIVANATSQLAGCNLIGYHCSRLHLDDISNIRSNGMATLSPTLLRLRVEERVTNGDIPNEVGQLLLSQNDAGDEWRAGQTWFINSRSMLRDESGVYRLFRSWGGEALYRCHERDPVTGALLRQIGVPCIVVASLPLDHRFRIFSDIGEPFYSVFLHNLNVVQAHGHTLEGYMREALSAEHILAIYQIGDAEFEELTGFRGWQQSIL